MKAYFLIIFFRLAMWAKLIVICSNFCFCFCEFVVV